MISWCAMRVLLDECVPRQLRLSFVGHEVRIVADMGWRGIKNGDLMRQAAGQLDVLLTTDPRGKQ